MEGNNNGWQESANAWIADMGEHGDFGRRYVLDPVMLPRALHGQPTSALDIGCGEGRFCRLLRQHGLQEIVGIDPTTALLDAARQKDLQGTLTLIDIPDIRAAIPEMARVLKPGGRLLIANLNSFNSSAADQGWAKDSQGRKLHYPLDNYMAERAMWIEYRGIRIVNHHRPLSVYMRLLLDSGLELVHFDEPAPVQQSPKRAADYMRVPWFLVMEWRKQ
jgi:SAM-dependent methyltransferase